MDKIIRYWEYNILGMYLKKKENIVSRQSISRLVENVWQIKFTKIYGRSSPARHYYKNCKYQLSLKQIEDKQIHASFEKDH